MKQFAKQEGVAPVGLTLEAATMEQLRAEAAKEKMAEKAAAPLAAKAAQEDLATGDMFERTSLFQPPVAETPERAATLKAENAKRQTTIWDKLEQQGREGYEETKKRQPMGPDPERFFFIAEIGAAKIGRGVTNFARWSAEMVKEIGEWIREFLPEIWKQAQAIHAEKTKPALPSEEHTVAEIQEAGRAQVERDAGLGGVDRASVTPPSEPRPTLPPKGEHSPGGKAFMDGLTNNEAELKKHFGFSWTAFRDTMASALRDVHRPITRRLKGVDDRVVTMFKHLSGSSPHAHLEAQDVKQKALKFLPKEPGNLKQLDAIRFAKRVIEATALQEKRGEKRVWPKGFTPTTAKAFLADEAKRMGPEKFKKYEDAAQVYSSAMENEILKLREAGLLSEKDAKYILENHKAYMPLDYVSNEMDPTVTSFGYITGKKVSIPDSGIHALGEGDVTALLTNSQYLLEQVTARTGNRIAKNNLNKALYESEKAREALGIVTDLELKKRAINLLRQQELPPEVVSKYEQEAETLPYGVKVGEVSQSAGPNMEPIELMIQGEKRTMWMPKSLVKYWTPPAHAEIADRVIRIMNWVTGANVVRALATGYNPEFSWRNLFMDSGFTWFRTDEYSMFLPKAIVQRVQDLRAVTKDAWNFGPETRAFIEGDGSMDFLTMQGSLGRSEAEYPGPHHEFTEKALNVLSKPNNVSEMKIGRAHV